MIRLVVDKTQLRQQARELRTQFASGHKRVFLVLNHLGGLQVYTNRSQFNGVVLATIDSLGLDFKTDLLDKANVQLIESIVFDPA